MVDGIAVAAKVDGIAVDGTADGNQVFHLVIKIIKNEHSFEKPPFWVHSRMFFILEHHLNGLQWIQNIGYKYL